MTTTPQTVGPQLVEALEQAVTPAAVLAEPSPLHEFSHDRSFHHWEPPAAVVRPRSTAEVAAAVRVCADFGVPVVPRGAGTGLEGGANTTGESVCIDLSRMDAVLEVAADDMYARVQAGVMKSALNAAAAGHGLHFPAGPGVDASIGGMAATSASGTMAVSCGTVADNVLRLTAVLGDGSVITTGSAAPKTSAGYDLTRLLVGSEGTLGIITEVTVRLHPVPEEVAMGIWTMPSLQAAAELVVTGLRAGVRFSRVELLDATTVEALRGYRGFSAPPAPTLMVEFAGAAGEAAALYRRFTALAEKAGAAEHSAAEDPDDVGRLWQVRHDALPAALALVPGASALPTDVCVPISQLPANVIQARRDVEELGLTAPIVGHVGDGNFHVAILLPPGDEQAAERAAELNRRLVDRALAAGGTCTGEHGIGAGKIASLAAEHASALPAMRAIKAALDPHGIMNPHKVLPSRSA